MPVLAGTTEKKVLLLMNGLMDELILISRDYLRSTRQTNYDVVNVTDDARDHCTFIDIFQQERRLVSKNLEKTYLNQVFECPRYIHSIKYTLTL